MQQFQVPQFITVEDRVIGPLTIKQFLFLAAGGLLILGARAVLEPFLFVPVSVLVGALAGSLAFLKINEQPLPMIFKNAIFYVLRPRLYIWRRETKKEKEKHAPEKKQEVLVRNLPKLSQSKLSDLAWSLDIKEKIRP